MVPDPMSELHLSYGVRETSANRFRLEGKFAKLDHRAKRMFQLQLGRLAAVVRAAVVREFRRHNRTGATLKTLKVIVRGWTYVISMGGGAPFIEYGAAPHVITSDHVMHFFSSGGDEVFTHSVSIPRLPADPFMKRAANRVHVVDELRPIATYTFAEVEAFAYGQRNGSPFRYLPQMAAGGVA